MKRDRFMSAVQRPVRRELASVQAQLRESFRTPIPILNQVGGHVLATRGKKFRPTLLLLVARLRGQLGPEAVWCATVVEMVHAAALIHDDSVDRSALRRGKPTVNGIWTDEMAIIVGDYLYAQAMSTMVQHKLDIPMSILSRVVSEMTCGEALEFQYARDLDVTEAQYEELVRSKTGSLIGAATEIGAGLNGDGGDLARRERFKRFGEVIGVAFQIVDDLLDYLGDPELTGKPVGSDLAEGKVTLPLIAALRAANESDGGRLRRLASKKRWTERQWAELRGLIEKCGGFAYARQRARALAEEARRITADEFAQENGARRPRGVRAAIDSTELRAVRVALDRAVDYAVQREC